MLLSKAFEQRKILPTREIREDKLTAEPYGLEFSIVFSKSSRSYYADAEKFFQRTYFTKTLTSALYDIISKTGRDSGRSCYVIDTTFGGGKTHLLVSLWHLFKSPEIAQKVPEIKKILDQLKIESVPGTFVVPLDGNSIDAEEQTLWGCLAEGVGLSEEAAKLHKKRNSPSRDKIREMLESPNKPVLILIDELVVYLRKALAVSAGETTLSSQVGPFIQALLGAVTEVPNVVIVLTLSAIEQAYKEEAAIIANYLKDVKSIAERSSWVTAPIEKEEIYSIVRKQLFEHIDGETTTKTVEDLLVYYEKYGDQFIPKVFISGGGEKSTGVRSTSVSREFLLDAYPFHYAFIDLLYERIGTLPQFQKTRGVLRFLSQVLVAVWKKQKSLPPHDVIVSGTIDLREKGIRDEITVKIEKGEFDQVIQSDIVNADATAKAQKIDDRDFGGDSVAVATAIYFYSFVGTATDVDGEKRKFARGGSIPELAMQCCLPSFDIKPDDLEIHIDKHLKTLWFMYEHGGRYFFRTEYNINKVIAEKSAQVNNIQLKKRASELLKEHFKGKFFQVHVLEKELGRVTGSKPALVLVDWDYETTNGKVIPQKVMDIIQRYSGGAGVFRDEQNFVYCLIPYISRKPEALESLKRLISVESLLKDKSYKKDWKTLNKLLPEYMANAYTGLELFYNYIAYPAIPQPKLISLTSGDQKANSAHQKVVSALFNAKKFTDQLQGWVINEEYLSGKPQAFKSIFEKIKNSPGEALTISDSTEGSPQPPSAVFTDIIIDCVVEGEIGLYNDQEEDLVTIDEIIEKTEFLSEDYSAIEKLYMGFVDNFFFKRPLESKNIKDDSILLPKEVSQGLVGKIDHLSTIYDQIKKQVEEEKVKKDGKADMEEVTGKEDESEKKIKIEDEKEAITRVKPKKKIVTLLDQLDSISTEAKVVGFGIFDYENPSETVINDITRLANQLNLLWRGEGITLSCSLKIGDKFSSQLTNVPYPLLIPYLRWCNETIREFASKGLFTDTTSKLTIQTQTETPEKSLSGSLKEKLRELMNKAPETCRITVIEI